MRRSLAIAGYFIVSVAPAFAQQPSPRASHSAVSEEDLRLVSDAIQEAHSAQLGGIRVFNHDAGEFSIFVDGPLDRIKKLARAAEKEYRPFELQEAARQYASDRTVWVYAIPGDVKVLDGILTRTPRPKEVLLQPHGVREISQTVRAIANVVERDTDEDKTGEYTILGKFPPDVFARFTGPGPVDVVILTDGEERRYVLPVAQMKALR